MIPPVTVQLFTVRFGSCLYGSRQSSNHSTVRSLLPESSIILNAVYLPIEIGYDGIIVVNLFTLAGSVNLTPEYVQYLTENVNFIALN